MFAGLIKYSAARAAPVSSNDNAITIDKTAAEIGYKKYEITLNIKGTPVKRPLDIVLAIDCSKSMGESSFSSHSSLYYACMAAKNFAAKVLSNSNTSNNRISIVKFSDNATSMLPLTNSLDNVNSTLDALYAGGNTNITDAFLKSENEIRGRGRQDAEKVIILLSDGVPNRPSGNPKDSAINEGKNAQKLCGVFTVGLLKHVGKGDKEEARRVLKACQNKGYYETDNGSGLDNIYTQILDEINVAAKNSIVTDVISSKFRLVSNSITYTKGEAPIYDEGQRKITWNVGTIKNESCTMKYQIEALSTTKGNNIPTNDNADLKYNDWGGNLITLPFPVPTVNVIDASDILKLNKSAQSAGNRDYEVNLNITGALVKSKPLDVALVIDTSGSMGGNSKSSLDYAKEAAKSFASKIISDNTENRVAVVSYASYTSALSYTNDEIAIDNKINGLNADGGTNIDKAFRDTETLIASNGRSEAEKAVVLLTDGVATEYGDGAETPDHYSDGLPFNGDYYPNYPRKDTPATVSAYESGRALHNKAMVFTVGLTGALYSDGNDTDHLTYNLAVDTLRKAQNEGFYETKAAADLTLIYDRIANKIEYIAKASVVTDVIPEGFTLIQDAYGEGKTFDFSQGTDVPTVSGKTITWNVKTVGNETVSLKYKLRADSNYYGNEVPTNVYARLNYKDPNDEDKTSEFNRPFVKVEKLSSSIGLEKKAYLDENYTIEAGDKNKAEVGKPLYYKFTITNNGAISLNSICFKEVTLNLKKAKIYSSSNKLIGSYDNITHDVQISLGDSLNPGDYIVLKAYADVTKDFVGGVINKAEVTSTALYKHVEKGINNGNALDESVNVNNADSAYVDVKHGELPFVGDNSPLGILYLLLALTGLTIVKLSKE